MEQTEKKLPTSIVIDEERKRAANAIRKTLAEAHEAYKSLVKMADLEDVPAPHFCTKAWLMKYINNKKASVSEVGFLSPAQKAAQIAHWEKVGQTALKCIRVLQYFIESLPAGQYVWNKENKAFFIKDIDSLLNERCTRQVPPDAETHYQLILNAKNVIKQLRNWEVEKDIQKVRLETLFNMTPEKLAEAWVMGLKIDRSHDHLPFVAISRQIEADGYL